MPAPHGLPRPEQARGAVDFLDLMRRLAERSGLPLSELEERTRAAGGGAGPAGLGEVLDGSALPSRELVAAFVTTCGLGPGERDRWLRAHARIEGTARPWHRLSLLIATPTVITIAVVVWTLSGVLHGEPGPERTASPPDVSTAASAPAPGWYTIMPLTGDAPSRTCLSILPDDRFRPRLAQDACDADDELQRIRLAPFADAPDTFRLKAWTVDGELLCATLDARTENAELFMKDCGDGPMQRFRLTRTGGPGTSLRLFDIVPQATRGDGMCVGVDVHAEGGDGPAVNAPCHRSGVRGYLLMPAAEPPAS
ncbi:hypothetical protein [Actinomadura sp. 9N215]|uniref:hypothetical protein n=1 Tax=Actinomadura sp. 9N215 TaxID=3375150 RepID=UPI0037AED270